MYDMQQIKKLPALGAKAPAAWEAFVAFDKAALADGAIPKKYKELIAVAVPLLHRDPQGRRDQGRRDGGRTRRGDLRRRRAAGRGRDHPRHASHRGLNAYWSA
jgi:hypothetical protein